MPPHKKNCFNVMGQRGGMPIGWTDERSGRKRELKA
jgi:hypothetical protein